MPIKNWWVLFKNIDCFGEHYLKYIHNTSITIFVVTMHSLVTRCQTEYKSGLAT